MCLSPSKESTVSTMCSSTLGPAIAPSFVTWPTMKTAVPVVFATRVKKDVASRTWLTLPGAEAISGQYIVCMESIIKNAGLMRSISASITVMSVSASSSMSPPAPSLCARSLS